MNPVSDHEHRQNPDSDCVDQNKSGFRPRGPEESDLGSCGCVEQWNPSSDRVDRQKFGFRPFGLIETNFRQCKPTEFHLFRPCEPKKVGFRPRGPKESGLGTCGPSEPRFTQSGPKESGFRPVSLWFYTLWIVDK